MCDTAMMLSIGKELSHLLPFKMLEVTFPTTMQTKLPGWMVQAGYSKRMSTCLTWRWGGMSQACNSQNSPFLSEGFMTAEGNRLDAKYTRIFRKYSSLNFLLFSPNQKDKSWSAAQGLRVKVGHSICTKILHGKPQVLPVPKNLQIT